MRHTQRTIQAWVAISLPLFAVATVFSANSATAAEPSRWPAEKAWQWYRSQPWRVGCNFLPSTAVNDVGMWQKDCFDAKTIDRELGWAQELGFNTVRVFVNYAVWDAEAAGLKDTFRRFLEIADKHGISTLVILFDDCFKPEPHAGKQPDPEPGVHNSQWVHKAREVEFIKATTGRSPETALPQRKILVSTAEQSPVSWGYTSEKPVADWFKPDFDGVKDAKAADAAGEIDRATIDAWSTPYRGWHYHANPVIPSDLKIPGHEKFHSFDVPTVYQLPGQPGRWFMSFIGFNGQGYNSFVAESTNLVQWTNPRLAMGFGPPTEFDHGGCVIGAFLYESYDISAPRLLKKRDGKYWTLYGCYPRQGGYELRPGYEGVAVSDDGLTWRRARNAPILAVQDPDCGTWEKDCIYQPWLVEHAGRFYNFYNAANGGTEQTGLAFSTNLLHWTRHSSNPVISNRPGGYDAQFASDPKVFRDGDHWVMFYFGVGQGGAHIMAAFSRDLQRWTSHPEPLYKAGGHPGGLDKQYAHKISLVRNPADETFYLFYCACGNQGRCIGLLTSRKLGFHQN